jgi:hypothetical protein
VERNGSLPFSEEPTTDPVLNHVRQGYHHILGAIYIDAQVSDVLFSLLLFLLSFYVFLPIKCVLYGLPIYF